MARTLRLPALAILWAAVAWSPAGVASQDPPQNAPDEPPNGERLYVSHCSRCHGIEGSGGEGPVLARPNLPKGRNAAAVARLIVTGIPDGGMPGTWSMSRADVLAVAEYVMGLGVVPVVDLSGDPANGRRLFFERGRCSTCHIVGGEGQGFGPELTDVGARRSPANLRQSIMDPDAGLPLGTGVMGDAGFASHLTVAASGRDGREVTGVRLNEDAFSIQLLDRRGRLHSYRKSAATIEKRFGQSLMPVRDLTPEQIDDLVAYLASSRGATWTSVSDS